MRVDTPEEKRLKELGGRMANRMYGCLFLAMGVCILAPMATCTLNYIIQKREEKLKKSPLLSSELRPYDLNKDGRLDPSELEKFQRDYELKKR